MSTSDLPFGINNLEFSGKNYFGNDFPRQRLRWKRTMLCQINPGFTSHNKISRAYPNDSFEPPVIQGAKNTE